MSGTIQAAISGTGSFGQLSISGIANLDGTFVANFTNSYIPNLGVSFQLITYASQTGTFDAVNGQNLPVGQKLNAVYNATNFTAVTANAAAAATVPARTASAQPRLKRSDAPTFPDSRSRPKSSRPAARDF